MPLYAGSISASVGPFPASAGPACLKCRPRVTNSTRLCATALAAAHLPIASWQIVRASTRQAGGRPLTGNADDAQAGAQARRCHAPDAPARMALPAGVAQVRAVRRDVAAVMQAVTSDHAGSGSDEI